MGAAAAAGAATAATGAAVQTGVLPGPALRCRAGLAAGAPAGHDEASAHPMSISADVPFLEGASMHISCLAGSLLGLGSLLPPAGHPALLPQQRRLLRHQALPPRPHRHPRWVLPTCTCMSWDVMVSRCRFRLWCVSSKPLWRSSSRLLALQACPRCPRSWHQARAHLRAALQVHTAQSAPSKSLSKPAPQPPRLSPNPPSGQTWAARLKGAAAGAPRAPPHSAAADAAQGQAAALGPVHARHPGQSGHAGQQP